MNLPVDALRAKIINIVHRPFKSLPLAIDIPRLAANFEVRRAAEVVWSLTGSSPQETLRSLLQALTAALDGKDVMERFQADYGRYMGREGQDVSKALERFMDEVLGGDKSRTVQLLKAANQAIIGPAVVELKLALGPTYMTKDVRGWWRTEVQVEPSPSMRVQTRKRDICVRGTFLIEWTLAVSFSEDEATGGLTATDAQFQITLIRYGPALRVPNEAARLAVLRDILTRFAPAQVLASADEATDWNVDAPPSYLATPILITPSSSASAPAPSKPSVVASITSSVTAASPNTLQLASKDQSPETKLAINSLPVSRSSPSVASSRSSIPASESNTPAPATPTPVAVTASAPPTSPSSIVVSAVPAKLTQVVRTMSSDAIVMPGGSPVTKEVSESVRVITYGNGDTYEGQQATDGRREGRGVYTTAQGDVYVGTYLAGQRHGHGVYTRKDGSRYEGDFRDGCPHGMGVYVFEDGSIYRGAFVNDEFHGRGRWSSVKGDYYEGDYRKGKRHGNGVLMVAGTRYEGEWEDDARCGHGRLELSNGDWYEGGFVAGKFHGKGQYHFKATHSTVEATFRNGKPVSAKNGTM